MSELDWTHIEHILTGLAVFLLLAGWGYVFWRMARDGR